MKKRNLKSLTLNKRSISSMNSMTAIVGGSTMNLTTRCPTDSMELGCNTLNPLECIAAPNP